MSSSRVTAPARPRWIIPVVLLAVVALAAWWFLGRGEKDDAGGYRTGAVERGEIRTAISATGTLSATATVEVGTQVSGTLRSVEVDFNDSVTKDQVIARIDPSTFQARLDQASAALSSARAGLSEAQAVARNAELDYNRKSDLVTRQLISRTDADQAMAARDQARARIVSANAQVRQQQANVDSARLDLEKTVIRSPVDGVVLLRSVEAGQTVAASLQTPVLFKIAGDLRKMEIVLAIDEADIGQVREGQMARFTVDAFPDRNFAGRVKQVRLAATNTANVITYPVVVEVDNPDQTLLPGMTANAEIEISRRPDVLSVPNAALRFRPAEESKANMGPGFGAPANPSRTSATGANGGQGGAGFVQAFEKIAAGLQLDAAQKSAFDSALQQMRDRAQQMRAGGAAAAGASGAAGNGGNRAQGGPPQGGGADRSRRMAERMKKTFEGFRASLRPEQQARWDAELLAMTSGKRAPVYKLVDGKPEQVTIRVGTSDGSRTEIIGDGLAEGDLVIIGSARPTP
ncbi:MAG: efflux RND transporter periplasmic adaptor subunit [Gammaproteobacteria bacterium]|nr:efflux RND transporter periplasmic adaptor subunit [Gammaproteobacteria bacterium]